MSGVLFGAASLALLAGTGVFVGLAARVQGASVLALAAYVVAFAEVVALFLFLSAFNAVTRGSLLAGVGLVFVAAVAIWVLAGSPRARIASLGGVRFAGNGPLVGLALVVALAMAYLIALCLTTPPNGWDPLNYHLARAAFWLQSGGVGYIDNAYDQRLNFNPPNGEIGFAFLLGVTRDENSAGLVQLSSALAAGIGVYAFARRVGFPRRPSAFGSLVFLSLPLVLLQSSGTKNDILVGAFLIAAAVFFSGGSRTDAVFGSLALALAVGTKFTAAYGILVLLPIALAAPPRLRRAARLGGMAAGALIGSYWYSVNLHETGHVLGDQSNVPGLTAPFHPRENLLTAVGELVDLVDLSGGRGADILVYPLAAIVLAAALTLYRGARPARSRDILLGAAAVSSPVLLLVIAEHVGRPGLEHLYSALGRPGGYLGDAAAASPSIASDTASWFGPVGLALVLGVSSVGVRLGSSGSLPRLAVVAALAPLVWFALIALTLTYNPWLGRFFVLPIALAAALGGLALRRHSVAWATTTLAAVTVTLSLVHYAEKPSGLRLFDRGSATESVWTSERWQVQSQHAPTIGPILRFVEEDVPQKTSLALALSANDFGYPVFGAHLEREVVLVPFGSNARSVDAAWLLASRERSTEIDLSCWSRAFQSDEGGVFRRRGDCAD